MNLKILIAILIVGILAVAIPVTIKLNQQQTQLKSKASAGDCRDNPETPPSGYKWQADCSSTCTAESNSCPAGANDQAGWCYGFENGAKCLKLVQLSASGGGGGGATTCSANGRQYNEGEIDYVGCRQCLGNGSFGANCSDFGPNNGSGEWCACAKACASDFNTSSSYASCPGRSSSTGSGSGGSTSQACTPNSFDSQRCATCKGDGSGWQADFSNFGDASDKTQWCSCAQRASQAGKISDFNTNSLYVECRAQSSAPPAGGTPPAASAPPNGSPPPASAPEGSECTTFAVLNKNGTDVYKSGPIYETETYTFKMTLKNVRDTVWERGPYKLKAVGETLTKWEIPDEVDISKDKVEKNQSVVFNIDGRVRELPAGKLFEDRIFSFGMSGPNGAFGAACEPELHVQKKLEAPVIPTRTKCYALSDDAVKIASVQNCEDTSNSSIVHKYTENPINFPITTTTTAIHVKFFNQDNIASQVFTKQITLSPNPTISRVDCSYIPSGTGTQIIINGANLGAQGSGSVKIGDANAQIVGWTPIAINATVDQRLEGSKRVTVTADDGRKVEADCVVNTTTVTFTAKNQCSQEDFGADDVDVKIYQAGEEPIISEKIKLDKAGKAQGFAPKLEKNKNYTLLVKAPGTLAKKKEFKTGSGGTTIVDTITLPVGDIAPRNNPNGIINSQDTSLLVTQWRLKAGATQASGDLNGDGAVNSLDWSCIRLNFNERDEVFTPPAGTSSGSSGNNTGVGSTNPSGVGSTAPTGVGSSAAQ